MINDSLYTSVHEFKAGNKREFQNVYLLSYKLVFCRAMKIMKNEQDSYDIVQSVYIKLYSKIYQLSDEKKFVSWLLTMTDNECRNLLKSQKKSVQFSVMDDEDIDVINNIADECPNPVQIADSNELNVQIRSLLESLPSEQQKVMVMYYYDQMGIEEIASSLGCSAGTVKSRLNYGRKNMKKCIEKYEKCNSVKLYSSVLMWIVSDIKNFITAYTLKTAAVATCAAVLTTQAVMTTVKRKDYNSHSSIEYITEASETTTLCPVTELYDDQESGLQAVFTNVPAELQQGEPVSSSDADVSETSAAIQTSATQKNEETETTTEPAAVTVYESTDVQTQQTTAPPDNVDNFINGHHQPPKHDFQEHPKYEEDFFPGVNMDDNFDFDHMDHGFGNVMGGHHSEEENERPDERNMMPEKENMNQGRHEEPESKEDKNQTENDEQRNG